jgi:hypothetical protein
MSEPHVISAFKAKQEEIKKRISALKKEIKLHDGNVSIYRPRTGFAGKQGQGTGVAAGLISRSG